MADAVGMAVLCGYQRFLGVLAIGARNEDAARRGAAEQRIGARGKGAMLPRGAGSALATGMRQRPGNTPRTVYRITPLRHGAMPCEMWL